MAENDEKKAASKTPAIPKKRVAKDPSARKAAAKKTATKGKSAKGKGAIKDPHNTLIIQLTHGQVVVGLRPDLAPNTVERIKELARSGFYDGTPFHRVIPDFMAQGGDPTGTGSGGSGRKLKAEFSSANHLRGTVSMARAQHPDSADSQFFICFAPADFLDGKYTVFGQVESGMEFVNMIKKGTAGNNGAVRDPDTIVSMKVAANS